METAVQEPRIKVLANGARYDLDKKRIVSGAVWTSDDHKQLAQARRAKKQEAVQAAANAAVERGDWRTTYGDMAFVAAITDTAMQKATTPDDPKAIDAARFLLQETGLAEPKATEAGTAVADAFASTVAALLQALSPRDVVDPIVTDAETGEVVGGGGE